MGPLSRTHRAGGKGLARRDRRDARRLIVIENRRQKGDSEDRIAKLYNPKGQLLP